MLWRKQPMFDGTDPKTTPAAIAGDVRRSSKLQAAEAQLAAAKKRIAEIRAESAPLHGRPDSLDAGRIDAELRRLEGEHNQVSDRLYAARREVVPLRAEHGVK